MLNSESFDSCLELLRKKAPTYSMNEIMSNHLESRGREKRLYKTTLAQTSSQNDLLTEPSFSAILDEIPELRESCFVSLKFKRQLYKGRPSIALFINDVTKEVLSTICARCSQE